MDDDRATRFQKRVTPESFLRVLPGSKAPASDEGEIAFRALPAEISDRDRANMPETAWRVILTSAQDSSRALPMELRGDVTFGCSGGADETAENIDVDLADMDGAGYGVSHRHLKLRPAKEKLFLIDLGSRNGTYANGTPVTASSAYAIQDGDLITLGRLHLRVKIVQHP